MVMSALGDMGMSVLRQIPADMQAGLANGTLKLCGGVIRNNRGWIVAHLAAAPGASLTSLVPGLDLATGIAGNVQMAHISSQLSTVLSVAQAGVALSGLGLVVSIAGFAFMNAKLNRLDQKIAAIGRDVKQIKALLESNQKGKLYSAAQSLHHAEIATDGQLRRDLLIHCKRDFGTLFNQLELQWPQSSMPAEIELTNELYLMAMLGNAAVCSNLGMHESAALDLRTHLDTWKRQARTHVKSQLFADRPDRLLDADYAEMLPARTLVDLLDFANDADRGIDWIDDLRLAAGRDAGARDGFNAIAKLAPGSIQRFVQPQKPIEAVRVAKSLCAQADVLESTMAHYEFLQSRKMTALDFYTAVETARLESGQGAIFIVHASEPTGNL